MHPRSRSQGATLLEMLVAAGLFTLMGLLIFSLFRWAYDSFTHNQLRVDAQQRARTIVETLSREIMEGAPLPAIPGLVLSGMQEDSEPPSAILVPYPEKKTSQVTGIVDWTGTSTNEVAFTVAPSGMAVSTAEGSVAASDMSNYMIVRYRLEGKLHAEDQTRQGPLIRSVYPAITTNQDTGIMAYNGALDPLNSTKPWFLTVTGLGTPMTGPNGKPMESIVVPAFAADGDGMKFEIRHDSASSGTMRTSQSRQLELKVTVKRFPRGDRKREVKEANEMTRITVRGG